MKPKKCKICQEKFTPKFKSTEPVCSKLCEIKYKANSEKKKHKIKHVSDKRKDQNKEYSKIRLQFLASNFLCQRCGKPADEVHHKAGRNGERLTDFRNFMTVCRPCHRYIHDNPKESREKGWLL